MQDQFSYQFDRWSTVWISFFKCYAWILCWKMHVISKFSPDYKLGILLSRTRPTKNDFRRNMYGNNLSGPEIWTSFNSSVKLGNHSVSFATTKNRTENKTTEFNTCIDKMPASIWTKFSVKKLRWISAKWRSSSWNENDRRLRRIRFLIV